MDQKTFIRQQTIFIVSLLTFGPNVALPVSLVLMVLALFPRKDERPLAPVIDLCEYRRSRQVRKVSYKKAA